jgi:Flp pilus assembly secretin CpaC
MTAACARDPVRPNPVSRLVAAFLLAIFVSPAAAEPIIVQLDQATIMQLPDRSATVVVGNPLIADLTVEEHGAAKVGVITGKGYGATNFIVLDRGGVVLLEKTIEVTGPSDKIVVVYRGVTHQTYSCTPDCARRITLGDTGQDYFDGTVDKDYFAKTLDQTVTRDAQAAGVGGKDSGH